MKPRHLRTMIGMAVILLLASACGIIPTRGSGNLISEARDVSDFEMIVFSGAGDAEIIQDGTESITIETDDNLMQYVETEVRGGTLYVGLDFNGAATIIPTKMNITLHVVTLSEITASGAWDVSSESLETEKLEALISGTGNIHIGSLTATDLITNISGAGDMEIAGQVISQRIGISGTGNYLFGDLQSKTAEIDISGAGDVIVWATETLDVTISGTGNVDYYGKPQINFNESGAGNIDGLGDK